MQEARLTCTHLGAGMVLHNHKITSEGFNSKDLENEEFLFNEVLKFCQIVTRAFGAEEQQEHRGFYAFIS